jgi:DNA-binding NarL/FixJ family response regulator
VTSPRALRTPRSDAPVAAPAVIPWRRRRSSRGGGRARPNSRAARRRDKSRDLGELRHAHPLAWPDRRQIGAGHIRRELALLALVADGRTNREIAKTLFITERTAGAYVSSILARLGVRSRVEAATAHRLGITRT